MGRLSSATLRLPHSFNVDRLLSCGQFGHADVRTGSIASPGAWQKALVALANKNARILWAVLTREINFDPDHLPPVPQCKLPAVQEPQPA